MPSYTQRLAAKGLCQPPKWLPENVMYETWMGSVAYGVSTDNSDMDVYGFCIPPKEDVFPHLAGHIPGFGRQKQGFSQYQQHHIIDADGRGGRGQEYDITIYSIVKYFQLCMDNNPNMIDSLFTTHDCVLHTTDVGELVRANRTHFLHKGSWHKFRGYAYSQLSRLNGKSKASKRYASIQAHGYDLKFAYHTVRLILEVEMILAEHTLDLRRNSSMLKAIRNGEWSEQQVREWFSEKEKALEVLYNSSTLQYSPDERVIKQLLLDCLEHHYGDLSNAVRRPQDVDGLICELELLVQKYKDG